MKRKQHWCNKDIVLLNQLILDPEKHNVHPQHKLLLKRIGNNILNERYVDRKLMQIFMKYK